jgi:hypothetical protein
MVDDLSVQKVNNHDASTATDADDELTILKALDVLDVTLRALRTTRGRDGYRLCARNLTMTMRSKTDDRKSVQY